MKTRTLVAIPVGIILGCALGFSIRNMGYTAFGLILLGSIINPLIVYGIADRQAFWVSVVPNVMLALTGEVLDRARIPGRSSDILSVLLALIIVSLFALIAISPGYWLRNRTVKAVKVERKAQDREVRTAKGEGGKRQQSGNPFL